MQTLFLLFSLLFFNACQKGADGNIDSSLNLQVAPLKYPLKTGQEAAFAYQDVSTNPATFYLDDGDYKNRKGYTREFYRLPDGTIYNANYDLYWEDSNSTLEYNTTVAQNYCADLNISGNADWRLPNVYELLTLLDLESRTDLRESLFQNMPTGAYFTSNDVYGTPKTIIVNFGEHDFNITKAYKVYEVTASDTNVSTSQYGVLYATTSVPTYHIPNADDPYNYISKVVI